MWVVISWKRTFRRAASKRLACANFFQHTHVKTWHTHTHYLCDRLIRVTECRGSFDSHRTFPRYVVGDKNIYTAARCAYIYFRNRIKHNTLRRALALTQWPGVNGLIKCKRLAGALWRSYVALSRLSLWRYMRGGVWCICAVCNTTMHQHINLYSRRRHHCGAWWFAQPQSETHGDYMHKHILYTFGFLRNFTPVDTWWWWSAEYVRYI